MNYNYRILTGVVNQETDDRSQVSDSGVNCQTQVDHKSQSSHVRESHTLDDSKQGRPG